MLEDLHTMQYWVENLPEFRGIKRPMWAERPAHRAIAAFESTVYAIAKLDGPDHQDFELEIRAARRALPAGQRRVPGLRNGVAPEILAARAMVAVAGLWIPYVLGD